MSSLAVTTATASLLDDAYPDRERLFTRKVEGDFRVTALVIQADIRLCLVSCDSLTVTAAMSKRAAERIAAGGALPVEHIVICPTHTHHAFSTCDVLGLVSNPEFCWRIEDAAAKAAKAALAKLLDPGTSLAELETELLFAETQEATVGRNSRLLLKDGTIGWWGYEKEDVVRPTGPFDPDMPLIAFRRADGSFAALMYNRAVHNIGCLGEHAEVHSIGTYPLVARELEQRHGAPTLYFPGAIGSTHNVTYTGSGVPTDEAIVRLTDALERGMPDLRPALCGPVATIRRPFHYPVRTFDEATEAEKVAYYSRRYLGASAEGNIRVMEGQRAQLAPHQGEEREVPLQVIRLGEIAIVCVPCELFTRLGLQIRQRSPFRHTFIFGLANDDFSYIGDREGYELGGYQLWVGPHSQAEPGSGEALVEQAVAMLEELYELERPRASVPEELCLRDLRPDDALGLQCFYNSLSHETKRLFRPNGWNMTYDGSAHICRASGGGERADLVYEDGQEIVGWGFLLRLAGETPSLGIGLAERYCGRGLGRRLMEALIQRARDLGKPQVELTVVQDNERAWRLYESCGFVRTGNWRGPDGQDYYEMRLGL